ncbi:hypothetical protein TCSYLVIO_002266 [Trypanosoma cruzi]|nr:hypothetical protein TCSYLVIO_002266 [Trypanosoma cruzi]
MQHTGDGISSRSPGLRLVNLLFSDYLSSPAFGTDVLQTILSTSAGYFTRRRSDPLIHSMNMIPHLILLLLVECLVLETLLKSGLGIFHDAGVFHVVFQYVQQYRFFHCWITRFLCTLGNIFLPSGIRQLLGRRIAETVLIPATTSSDPLKAMPVEYRESLRYYCYMYDRSVPYAVFLSGFVCEMTHCITEQLVWLAEFYRSRHKHTSRWRLLKPYISSLAGNTTQMLLVYSARVVGAWAGRSVSREPTGRSVFWGESVALLALSPAIHRVTTFITMQLRNKLEMLCPATPEDEREDFREEEMREEEEEEPTAFRMQFNNPSPSGTAQVDFYEVLGVKDTASAEEIKRAYRKAALANHPDRVGHEEAAQKTARERMTSINQAYETLSSESRRRRYDMARQMGTDLGVVKHFENLSTPVVLGIGLIGLLGFSLTASLLLCGQYFAAFHQLTGTGRNPLRYLGIA